MVYLPAVACLVHARRPGQTEWMAGRGERITGAGSREASALRLPVVLVGMMGSGKTAVGTALAVRLGVAFHDTDEAIVDASRMTVAEIFARDGEPFFRERESEVLRRLLDLGPAIVSTGGGVFLRAANRAAIRAAGVSVWLRADPDLLWSRVRGKKTRPLLMTGDPRGTLDRLCAERAPSYAKADIVVECDPGLSVDAMSARVAGSLRRAGHLTEAA